MEKVQKMISFVASLRLPKGFTELELDNEIARIERCIDFHDKVGKVKTDYWQYRIDFLVANGNELVYGDKFSGMYIDDVEDVYYKDDMSKLVATEDEDGE